MKCFYCREGRIILIPSCKGLEPGCRECGHVYSPQEFRELLCRQEPQPLGAKWPIPGDQDPENDGVP
jgi:hypothetical protein